jgi:hypothetical protein
MSKQITAGELAIIVTRLLTDTQTTGEMDSAEAFGQFMTDIAQVVCDHCGGEIHQPASFLDDDGGWMIGIHGNDSLPDAFGGIWREFDPEGELFAERSPQGLESKFVTEHPDWPKTDWQYDVANNDTKLGYWEWVAHNVESASTDPSECTECGAKVPEIIGCPDGAELCQACFDAGDH